MWEWLEKEDATCDFALELKNTKANVGPLAMARLMELEIKLPVGYGRAKGSRKKEYMEEIIARGNINFSFFLLSFSLFFFSFFRLLLEHAWYASAAW